MAQKEGRRGAGWPWQQADGACRYTSTSVSSVSCVSLAPFENHSERQTHARSWHRCLETSLLHTMGLRKNTPFQCTEHDKCQKY